MLIMFTFQFIRHNITESRNSVLLVTMRDQLDRGEKPSEGKKTVKAQDVVRMYENMIQSLAEIPSLAGLEGDEKLSSDIETKITFYKAFRSYYIALAFIASQKWAEAMAVFQRSLQYVSQVRISERTSGNIPNISLLQARARKDLGKELSSELPKLEEAIESKQFVAHANSILETESATEKVSQDCLVSSCVICILIYPSRRWPTWI